MSLAAKVAYNTVVQILSKVITTILGLLAVAVMARYLGPVGFGEYTTAFTFLSFFGIMADLGLTLVTVQMISRPGADENKIIKNLFSLRFVTAAAFLVLAPISALFFPYSTLVRVAILAALPSFFFTALNQILVGVFQKYLHMEKVSIAETAGRVALFLGVIAAARFDWGLTGVMLAITSGGAINFLLHLIFSLKYVQPGFEFDFSLWREVLTKAWPLALTIFFNLLYLKTDTLVLSVMKSQYEVGIYGAAYKVIDILTTIPFMFAGVVMPILALAWAGNNQEYFKKIVQKSFDLMLILAIPLIVGTQFAAEPVMDLVAGQDFSEAGPVLKILMVAAGLVFLSCLLSHVMVAAGRQKEIIGSYFFTALTSVVGYIVFIPKYSYFAAAWFTVYSELAITLFMFWYLWKYARFLPKMQVLWKSLLASALMGLGLYLLPSAMFIGVGRLSLSLLGASAVYFVLLYVLKGVDKEDLLKLLKRT